VRGGRGVERNEQSESERPRPFWLGPNAKAGPVPMFCF
jgi:hypothetical protein